VETVIHEIGHRTLERHGQVAAAEQACTTAWRDLKGTGMGSAETYQ